MQINVLKSKIHRAIVTEANLDYIGSITIDEALMEAAGIYEYEKVSVVNVTNGARLETYVIRGERGSGVICLNGAAAHLIHRDDIVIIMAYTWIEHSDMDKLNPKIIFPKAPNNRI
ncbi:aspartate decarboxylase [Porphyromonadaceae bacterium COT-184 OH4590]|nr:aspartate decarboxylase [Porphyromonadaceae bacterium COT-184 OH4590]